MKPTLLEPSLIRTDGGTQPRVRICDELVDDYAASYRDNDPMPPLDVFYDGTDYWLADGFHRLAGAIKADQAKIECFINEGSLRDAVLFSVGANATHGQRRTNVDKRRAVKTLLEDPEWQDWSDNVIARACHVSNHLVADIRDELFPDGQPVEEVWTSPKEEVQLGEFQVDSPLDSPKEEEIQGIVPPQPPKSGKKRKGADGKLRPAKVEKSTPETNAPYDAVKFKAVYDYLGHALPKLGSLNRDYPTAFYDQAQRAVKAAMQIVDIWRKASKK